MSRPVVSVYDPANIDSVVATVSLPAVFTAPIRSDVVQYVHTMMAKNKRQAYGVNKKAGHQVQMIYFLPCPCDAYC
ncbi:50S ribosomal protein L4 [archaeon]|nr:MAG: 50S ribosomal protein L4 [archaeon]